MESRPIRIRFITSTPWNVAHGSGTFVGIATLADSLRALGASVDVVTPKWPIWPYTLRRLLFNWALPWRHFPDCDVTVGFDMDGYSLAGTGRGAHVAAIKGVIADEARFESGITRATMLLQASREKLHVQRADLVITTSEYSSERVRELYHASMPPRVVPELIDLNAWRNLSAANQASPPAGKFVVLSVCRFYPRKRVHILLAAADRLRSRIAGLEVRIVGDGPEMPRLKTLFRQKRLEGAVAFLGTVSQAELAREYSQCHLFCLPSVQEGFGVVFLEAMANGKPIVAVKAGAAPEVVRHGLLAEPNDEQSLAGAIERLYRDADLRTRLGSAGQEFVKQFDAPIVAGQFLHELEILVKARRKPESGKIEDRGSTSRKRLWSI